MLNFLLRPPIDNYIIFGVNLLIYLFHCHMDPKAYVFFVEQIFFVPSKQPHLQALRIDLIVFGTFYFRLFLIRSFSTWLPLSILGILLSMRFINLLIALIWLLVSSETRSIFLPKSLKYSLMSLIASLFSICLRSNSLDSAIFVILWMCSSFLFSLSIWSQKHL